MVESTKKEWTASEVEASEYEMLRFVILSKDFDKMKDVKEFQSKVSEILNDVTYQKLAVDIVKDRFGITSLRGVVTARILLGNADKIDEAILDELLYNIVYSYQDEKSEMSLLNSGEFFSDSYLHYIIMQNELKLKEEYQRIIANTLIQNIRNSDIEEFDSELIICFLFRRDIDLELKMELINSLSSEQIYLLKCEADEWLLKNMIDFMSDLTEEEINIMKRNELKENNKDYCSELVQVFNSLSEKMDTF